MVMLENKHDSHFLRLEDGNWRCSDVARFPVRTPDDIIHRGKYAVRTILALSLPSFLPPWCNGLGWKPQRMKIGRHLSTWNRGNTVSATRQLGRSRYSTKHNCNCEPGPITALTMGCKVNLNSKSPHHQSADATWRTRLDVGPRRTRHSLVRTGRIRTPSRG